MHYDVTAPQSDAADAPHFNVVRRLNEWCSTCMRGQVCRPRSPRVTAKCPTFLVFHRHIPMLQKCTMSNIWWPDTADKSSRCDKWVSNSMMFIRILVCQVSVIMVFYWCELGFRACLMRLGATAASGAPQRRVAHVRMGSEPHDLCIIIS